jgi:uncharacterized protein (TIGR02246 family)
MKRTTMNSDEQAILTVHKVWIEAVNAGDVERLLTLMTDDAMFLNPGQAPLGREGFPVGFSAAHREFQIRCVSEPQEVVVAGDVAHAVCTDSLSLVPRRGGEATTLAGHRLTVYRRQADGHWRLARDAHTLSPVAS